MQKFEVTFSDVVVVFLQLPLFLINDAVSALENNVSSTMTSLGIYPLVSSLRVFIERIFNHLALICRLMLCC